MCVLNPKDCPDGLSFAIWEKAEFSDDILFKKNGQTEFKRKYIISSGSHTEGGKAWDGFALWREVS